MFFVKRIKKRYRTDFLLIHWLPTFLIFATFFGATILYWQNAKERAEEDRREALNSSINETKVAIARSVNTNEGILRAGASLFNTSDDVTREEWKDFANLFDLPHRYPAISTVGYIKVIPGNSVVAHQNQIRASDNSLHGYQVFPSDPRPYYTSILYLEPSDAKKPDLQRIGFDPYTKDDRREAMDKAIATQKPTMTDSTFDISDKSQKDPVLISYFPIYINDQIKTEGLSNVSGFVFDATSINELFSSVLPADKAFGYKISSLKSNGSTDPIYKTANFDALKNGANSVSTQSELAVGNKNWLIEANTDELAGTPEVQNRPNNILVGGLLISLLITSFVYLHLLARTRSFAKKEDAEIQMAKDELLALASHQLRTPATGVKQYMGMLKEGYAGRLNSDQRYLLDKAEESNERQLTTINEMLSVARADAGRLPINKERIDVSGLLKDVIEEQYKLIEERDQKLSVRIPQTPLWANLDPQYFRMAVENIINNASKYTPKKGAIDITLKKVKQDLIISVHDTGVGIPSRHYAMLFKKFSRIPNELTTQVSGTGIGLYLSKYIVEAHGGKLRFISEPGVGSTFEIVIKSKKNSKKQ
jgi:signal transduction histidine kinase